MWKWLFIGSVFGGVACGLAVIVGGSPGWIVPQILFLLASIVTFTKALAPID